MEINETSPESILLADIDSQVAWYGKKARFYKKTDLIVKILLLIFTTAIPFLIVCNFDNTKYVIALISMLIAILEGFRNIYKSNEKWILYRSILEKMKKERLMYLTETSIYRDKQNKVNLLAKRYIEITSYENEQWETQVNIPDKIQGE
ncbi:DUF4231 domain-containing protein [Desulfovibrio sp. 6_1_46AFAA]|uniref:DUF4231 domain-containing protein n=1 Tax=Desulfovibrio sp. 6_1_46AFAA TaxID=665942 RepID=UPI000558E178|nr:DUF4231 domain-containing protein [Desulfovibrio sp. 6_1_46AFAA]